jgi:signal peptidase II
VLGNLIERIFLGRVTDFVLWHWREHAWPIFNLADAFPAVSVGIFLVRALRRTRTS